MVRKCLIIAIMLVLSVPVWSQDATSAAASKEEVMKLLKVMRVNSQMTQMLNNMSTVVQTGAREGFLKKKPNATEKQLAALDKMMGSTFQEFSADELIAEIIPVYQRNLTSEEVSSLVSFYNSPSGQKILDKMPKLTQDAMQVGVDYARKKMDAAMTRMEALSKDIETEEGSKK